MKKNFLFMLFCTLILACNNQDSQIFDEAKEGAPISFRAFIKQATRATETTFENGDAISVFAVAPTSTEVTLASSGNYADNVCYTYDGRSFVAGANSIAVSEIDAPKLAYYAIYPYLSNASNKFQFSVKNNQGKYADYTASDLCTAYVEPTTSAEVLLEFGHRMSCVEVKFYGENLVSKKIGVRLDNIYTSCNVDINADTYTATGTKGNVILGEHSSDTYQAIIVPQTVSSEQTFISLTIGGKVIPLNLAATMDFKSGKKTIIELEIEGDKVISLNGYTNSWNDDECVDCEVVPTNFVTLTDGVAFDFNFGKNVSYYYYGYIEKDLMGSVTDDEIAETAQEIFTRYTPEDGMLGYVSGLDANKEYYIVSLGYDSKDNRGEIIKTLIKTKANVTNRPCVTISDVTYSSTEWNWETTISSNTKKYYMSALSGDYASVLSEMPNVWLAWYMKDGIDNGEYTPVLSSDSWWMSRESTDNYVYIYAWAVGGDDEFSGELDTFFGSLVEETILSSRSANKNREVGVVSKDSIREYMKNVVNIKK